MLFIIKKYEKRDITLKVKKELESINLPINKKKTCFVNVRESIDYLGYNLRLPIVSVKQTSIEGYLRSLSALFAYAKVSTSS